MTSAEALCTLSAGNSAQLSREKTTMRIRLSDVVPEEELTSKVEALVHDILDRVITIEMYEGPVKRQKHAPAPPPAEPIVCPECGKDDFRSKQALAGHLFHKHDIRLHEGEVAIK